MTDNTVLNLGAGGDTAATEDIGGVKWQLVKLTVGGHGVNSGPVADANPLPIYFPPVSPTDRSGTITAGGTAQVLSAAKSNRRGWWIRNNSISSLWVSDMTTAVSSQPSLEIVAGAYYESPIHGCSSLALSIIGATTAQSFTAREW